MQTLKTFADSHPLAVFFAAVSVSSTLAIVVIVGLM